jgi:hypothetical protein
VWNWSVICLELVSYLYGIGLFICVELFSYLCGIGQLFAQQSVSMQCPLVNFIARNKTISASVTSGWGQSSVVNSVKVAMVVSFSLHHQQYDS